MKLLSILFLPMLWMSTGLTLLHHLTAVLRQLACDLCGDSGGAQQPFLKHGSTRSAYLKHGRGFPFCIARDKIKQMPLNKACACCGCVNKTFKRVCERRQRQRMPPPQPGRSSWVQMPCIELRAPIYIFWARRGLSCSFPPQPPSLLGMR